MSITLTQSVQIDNSIVSPWDEPSSVKPDGWNAFPEMNEYALSFASDRVISRSLMAGTTRLIEDTGRWEPNEELGMEVSPNYQTRKPHGFGGLICFENEDGSTFQYKPVHPTHKADGGLNKYLFPKGSGSIAFLPSVDATSRAEIGRVQGFEVPSVGSFWEFVQATTMPIVITEGPGKSLSLLSHGVAAIALGGINGGYRSNDRTDNQVLKLEAPELIADLLPFVNGRSVFIAFDSDSKPSTIQAVNKAVSRLGSLLEASGAVVSIVNWDNKGGSCKGVDDLLRKDSRLWDDAFKASRSLREWRTAVRTASSPLSYITAKGVEKLLTPSESADYLAKIWGKELAWNTVTESYFEYGAEHSGLWKEEPEIVIQARVQGAVRATGLGCGAEHITGIMKLLKGCLLDRGFNELPGYIPLRNGVLNLATMVLSAHDPQFKFTWQLPYDYSRVATCNPIIEWLSYTQHDDVQRVQVLRGYLKAIVCGRNDLQRFIELIGPGGTGKSTFINLAQALIGLSNCHVTSLDRLENNRFETALIYGKKLVSITDSDKYGGGVSVLKALTGQDPLPFEQKYKKAQSSFVPNAMVAIASNEPIATSDYTSGMKRRKLTIPFNRRVAPGDRRDLITLTGSGEFAEFLPGLLNWVLDMPDSEMVSLIVDTDKQVPALAAFSTQNLTETNPLAQWLDAQCIWAKGHQSPVGILPKGARVTVGETSMPHYPNSDIWLYPNYVQFCEQSGAKALSLKRFSPLLLDLCNSQLGRSDVLKGSKRAFTYIEGIAIRGEGQDSIPRPITESQETAKTQKPTPEQVWETIPDELRSECKARLDLILSPESVSDEDMTDLMETWEANGSPAVRESVWAYLEASETGLAAIRRMESLSNGGTPNEG